MAYKGLKNNKKTTQKWKNNILDMVKNAEVKSLTEASQYFVAELVRQAQFNDFTGSLNASYVAGIYHNGAFVRRTATSLPYADTAPIKINKGKWVPLKKERMSVDIEGMRAKSTHYGKGFGHRTDKLRKMSPKGEYAVLMTNTAPYAEEVQSSQDRRVMPGITNKYAGTFLRILRNNIKARKV